jgi:excisionase family DNA binding protein
MPGKSNKFPKPAVNGRGRRWASIPETAAYIGCTDRGIRLMITDGRIVAYRGFGERMIRIDLNEVDAALAGDTQK